MKLYYSKGTCSLAVRIVINEIGVPCEFESVDLKTKITATGKNFFEINKKGVVPALQLEDGSLLTENAVIQQYLADVHHATALLPAVGELRRYRVLEWLNFVSTELHKSCGPLFNPTLAEDVKETIFRPLLKSKLTLVDEHLSQNKYLMGTSFTLPDGYLFVVLTWLKPLKLELAEWSHLSRYMQELRQRKSIQQALADEG